MAKPVQTTIRQELFLRELMKTGIAAEAWRRIYKPRSKTAAQVSAYKALKKPHIRRRYNELLERQMKKADISIDKILTDYQYALDRAKVQDKPGEMVSAATAQAKLVGLLRDRVETGAVGDFGDVQSVADILEIVGKEAGPEAALALANMFGVKPEKATSEADAAILMVDPPTDSVN